MLLRVPDIVNHHALNMGHSFVYYEEDSELLHDIDLWALRHFFIEEAKIAEAEQPNDCATKLRGFFEMWEWVGNGVYINTDFATYVSEQKKRWELLIRHLERTNKRIAEFGEFVPLDYLTVHLKTPHLYFRGPLPTETFSGCIEKIHALLIRHEPKSE